MQMLPIDQEQERCLSTMIIWNTCWGIPNFKYSSASQVYFLWCPESPLSRLFNLLGDARDHFCHTTGSGHQRAAQAQPLLPPGQCITHVWSQGTSEAAPAGTSLWASQVAGYSSSRIRTLLQLLLPHGHKLGSSHGQHWENTGWNLQFLLVMSRRRKAQWVWCQSTPTASGCSTAPASGRRRINKSA